MYESFFEMEHTPFTRDIPVERLYTSPQIEDALGRLDRAETGKYVASHMAYVGARKEIFTSGAEDEVYKISVGIPRMINRVCEKALMYACQQQKRLVDEHMVRFVADHEMLGGVG